MENKKTGVGIIGAGEGGWAVRSHLPALQMLKGEFTIVAVSTRDMKSATATANQYGIPNAFDNECDLVNHPEVELVVITVKVPAHKQLVETLVQAKWFFVNGHWVMDSQKLSPCSNLRKKKE